MGMMTGTKMSYVYHRGIAVHRLVLAYHEPRGYHPVWMDRVDHINRVKNDNRHCNLRWSNSVLNGLNSVKAGKFVTRPFYYMVQIRVMGQRHACSVRTVQDAVYMVHRCNRRTFAALEVLYKFLAAGDKKVPASQKPQEWLSRHFAPAFLRRLSGLPAKDPRGRRRTN